MYYLKRIKNLREKNNLKQKNLADLLQISRQQYGLYETGKREIPISHLKKLAEYYQTSADYILEITDETEIKRDKEVMKN